MGFKGYLTGKIPYPFLCSPNSNHSSDHSQLLSFRLAKIYNLCCIHLTFSFQLKREKRSKKVFNKATKNLLWQMTNYLFAPRIISPNTWSFWFKNKTGEGQQKYLYFKANSQYCLQFLVMCPGVMSCRPSGSHEGVHTPLSWRFLVGIR